LLRFRAVFVAVRNPYDLAYSTYKFQRLYASDAAAPPEFTRAANSSFDEFVAQFTPADYRSWLQYRERELPNIRVIRFESLKVDFKAHADEFGFRNPRMPHLNASGGESYTHAMTPALEEAIYDKYRFLFERGYYSRLAMPGGPALP
jgi:Sulfotransferase domain